MRRKSSTFKSALFSMLGSSPPVVQEDSPFLPKNQPNGSTTGFGAVRRGSVAMPEAIAPPEAVPSSESMSQLGSMSPAADEVEGAAPVAYQSDGGLDESGVPGSATTGSSLTNLSGGSQSLKSLGKEFLARYLTDRGLLLSRVISETPDLRLTVATTGDHVFLPTMSSNDDEYLARLNGLRGGEEEAVEVEPDYSLDRPSRDAPAQSPSQLQDALDADLANEESAISDEESEVSEEDLNVDSGVDAADARDQRAKNAPAPTSPAAPTFEIDNSMATYTMAVVLSLNRQTTLSNIKGELCSRIRVHWHSGVPPTKTFYEEFYCAGSLKWDLNPENANLFVPQNVSSDERIIENNRNLRPTRLFKNKPDETRLYLDKNKTRSELLKQVNLKKTYVFQPGDYVFIIPVVFSNHIPESLYLPSARVNYRFRVATKVAHVEGQQVAPSDVSEEPFEPAKGPNTEHRRFSNSILKKIKNNLHITNAVPSKVSDDTKEIYAEYPIDVVRTPPLVSISTANKPVYINRVWANSLSYEISFAQKYVSLGSKVPVKIKLAPLCKNICLKRLKISLVEKIVFVSKNYEYEYDQIDPVAKDPYNPYFSDFASKRKKERTISLLEVRSSEKGSRALREEVVENCLDENLLAYSSAEGDNGQPNIGITEPLSIETSLEFPKYEDLNKKTARTVPPYGIDIYTSVMNPEIASQSGANHRSGVIGFLANRKNSLASQVKTSPDINHQAQSQPKVDEKFHETKIRSNGGIPVQFHTNLNVARRGLYLSSLHFSNIYSKHKLEFMLRISKPDERDPKRLRHYEVLIDTPVFIVSELCNSGNMDLPTYDMATTAQPAGEMDLETAPPTFEEAISVPCSPIQSPVMSPIGSPNFRANYDPDDLSVHQLNLSRSNSTAGPSDGQPFVPPQLSLSQTMDTAPRFNNLDKLLSPTPGTSGADLSRTPAANKATKNGASHSNSAGDASQGTTLFKKGYSVSSRTATQGDDNDDSSSEAGDSIISPPPSYDEVRPLMSDEE